MVEPIALPIAKAAVTRLERAAADADQTVAVFALRAINDAADERLKRAATSHAALTAPATSSRTNRAANARPVISS
jgi:type IV secretory pathway TrbL component